MPSPNPLDWNPERVEILSRMWVEGKTAKQIAMALDCGASRSAVIGKVHRLKLPKRANPVMPTTRRVASVHGNKGQPKVNAIVARAKAKAILPPQDLDRVFDMEDGEGVDVSSLVGILENTGCKWVHGDPLGAHGYCGKPIKAGSKAWCPAHHARVYSGASR